MLRVFELSISLSAKTKRHWDVPLKLTVGCYVANRISVRALRRRTRVTCLLGCAGHSVVRLNALWFIVYLPLRSVCLKPLKLEDGPVGGENKPNWTVSLSKDSSLRVGKGC